MRCNARIVNAVMPDGIDQRPPGFNAGVRGAALVETIFATAALMLLVLGTIEVALALYARNVVEASAHEGARAGIELGRKPNDAAAVAQRTVRQAAGGLVDHLRVTVTTQDIGLRSLLRVRVSGNLESFGPVPVSIPVAATATLARETRAP
jgi:Flp pilus assembly protein TadG